MAKPNIDIKEVSLNTTCGVPESINITYKVFVGGPCRICLDIPHSAPVFFADTSSNSKCVLISNPVVGKSESIQFKVSFESLKKDVHFFMITGTITDSAGNSRSDYLSVQVDCR